MPELEKSADLPPKRKFRFRFSIRHLFLAIMLICVGLFLYREVPDMYRKRVYNDPVPLVVSDKGKIQIRQVPYSPGGQFLYRVHLPREQAYDLCLGETSKAESLPSEPKTFSLKGIVKPGEGEYVEWRISGFMVKPDPASQEKRIDIHVQTIHKAFGLDRDALSLTLSPRTQTAGRAATAKPCGIDSTESFAPDEEVVLYREFWNMEDNFYPSKSRLNSPGEGFVVWIRPSPPKETRE